MRGLAAGIRGVHHTNLHLTLRFLGDAIDSNRLVALGKNLSEMLPRRSGSSAILHFLWQDLRGQQHLVAIFGSDRQVGCQGGLAGAAFLRNNRDKYPPPHRN